MKRFLKVILILAAVFGVAGLGLTAGGAAMGRRRSGSLSSQTTPGYGTYGNARI
jgi:hypothetical protein